MNTSKQSTEVIILTDEEVEVVAGGGWLPMEAVIERSFGHLLPEPPGQRWLIDLAKHWGIRYR